MGRRKRMPFCLHCGKRIQRRYTRYHPYNSALERAMLLVQHRDRDPVARQNKWYNPAGGSTHFNALGYVTELEGRGWYGENQFCNLYCAGAWARRNAPEPRWEP